MNGYPILMFIFGGCIFLYGLDIYFSKNPLIPKMHKKPTEKEKKFIGKTTMVEALSPILSGLVSLLGDNGIIMTISVIVLILSFIGGMILSMKLFGDR